MDNVTDRTSNPFGMHPPCEYPCSMSVDAVYGFGDPNADFHLIGDHPGVHGGRETGIPFTDVASSERLLEVLRQVGLITGFDGEVPLVRNLFMSYLHMCCLPDGATPTDEDYATLERFFDAELRGIAAHVLMPVGERATRHVLQEFTAKAAKLDGSVDHIHARELSGRGFLVVPITQPSTWSDADESMLKARLQAVLTSDYRQESDLTRFLATDELYLVR